MSELNEFAGPVYEVCEAVLIRDALSLFINKTATTYKNRNDPDYLAAMTFYGHVYKKFARIAATPVELDHSGRMIIKKDLRKNFDLN
jgi:hypothetical protein